MKSKFAVILLFLTLVGCFNSKKKLYPKFHVFQKVEIVGGFFKGISGSIAAWSTCSDRDTGENVVCYQVDFVDPADNGAKFAKPVNENDIRQQ